MEASNYSVDVFSFESSLTSPDQSQWLRNLFLVGTFKRSEGLMDLILSTWKRSGPKQERAGI